MLKSKYQSIKNNKSFLKYFKNTIWLFVSKIISLFSVVFVGAWVAKYLGPESFGLLSYSYSIVSLFIPLAMIGLNDIVIKELLLAKTEKDTYKILGTSLGLKFLFGSLSFILIIIFASVFYDSYHIKLLIFILSFFLFLQAFEIVDLFFQSKVKSKFTVFAKIITVSISSIIKIIFIYKDFSIFYFAFAMVFEVLLLHTFTFYLFVKKYFSLNLWIFKKELAIKLLKKSWPLFLSGLMYIVYIRIDQVMVKEILGDKSAGLYAVAINLSEVWYFIPNMIVSSLFPAIIISKTKEKEVYHKRLINLYRILFWIAILVALFTTLFGEFIIKNLYGIEYTNSSSVLKIYIWSNVFFFFTTVSSKWLVVEGYYIHSFIRNIMGALMNIVINFVLLEKIGLIGAAISTLISYAFVGFFYDLLFKNLRINFRLKMKSIICSRN
ncbi:flippase [Polaribacter sp. WD7]|uniref:flippase n=1 Tax=Polaribacter sp. WD7 TaxID=2269061 RepID=UPI000DF4473A|nr:flippase [Polaribacter sp. WD7]RCS26234.1 flippase [Polaribacter sp. WD7]